MKPSAEIEWLFANFGTPVVAVDSDVIAPAPAAPLGSPSRRPTLTGSAPRGLLSREELPVVVTVAPNVIACALCRGRLGTKKVECTSCRSFVHPGCAKASGGCPSIGCGQRRARRARKLVEQAKARVKRAPKLDELRALATPAELKELRALALAPALPAGETAGASSLVDRLSLVGLFACLVTLLSCTACVAVVAMVRLAHLLGSA